MSGEFEDLKNLATYSDDGPRVESTSGAILTAYVGDDVPAIGEGLWVDAEGTRALARVVRHAGNRLVEAMLLNPVTTTRGARVERARSKAVLPAPVGARLDLSGAQFAPSGEGALGWDPERVGFMQIDARRPALELDLGPLDLLSPLARRGANLVVDRGGDARAFGALARAVHGRVAPEATLCIDSEHLGGARELATHVVSAGEGAAHAALALRAGALLGQRLRASHERLLVLLALPAWSIEPSMFDPREPTGLEVSLSELVDWLGEALVSTKTCEVTVLMRLPILESADGLSEVADTLAVGDLDAQVFVDDGVYDPWRSRSRAERDPAIDARALSARGALARAVDATERLAILGGEPEPQELADLELATALESLSLV